MTTDDRFSALKPQDIIATIDSIRSRFRQALGHLEGSTADDVEGLRTERGSVLDEVATTAAGFAATTAALDRTKDGGFPEVPPAVLGVDAFATVTATGTVDRNLRELDSQTGRLRDTLKSIPRIHWGYAARAAGRSGHATIEEIGRQAARTAVESLHRVEVAVGARPPSPPDDDD